MCPICREPHREKSAKTFFVNRPKRCWSDLSLERRARAADVPDAADSSLWLGAVPDCRYERHFSDRVIKCFASRPADIGGLLSDAIARAADREAIICGDVRLAYEDLGQRVTKLAGGLTALGLGAGDRIGLLLPNGIEFAVAFYAAAWIGAISVPLNIREPEFEIRHKLIDCGAKALIVHSDIHAAVPCSDACPDLAIQVVVGDRSSFSDAVGFDELAQAESAASRWPTSEEDVAAIIYTSGTTGQPKGVMLSHLGLVHAAMHYEATMGLGMSDRGIAAAPLTHVTGLTGGLLAAARAAATLIIVGEFKAASFLEMAARERMSFTVMVPAMYKLCLLQPNFPLLDLGAWRVAGYGGGPMPPALIEELSTALPDLCLINCYGATETSSPIAMMPPNQTTLRAGAVGRSVPCGEILIMDETGREMPAGQPGEIWLRAPMTAIGYWNNPTATREEFVSGFWRSGDIGSVDAEGYLTLLDRAKDVINRGGYKVFAIEVEAALASRPDIAEVAVIAKPCPVLGERVHAVVVPRGDGFDAEAARECCRHELADFKVPEDFTLWAEPLPRNANGKVLKKQLRQRVFGDHREPLGSAKQ